MPSTPEASGSAVQREKGPAPALELRSITAGYPGRPPVVRDVSLTVPAGESVALLGPSGCGKSTLARVAALLHRPDAGSVSLHGAPVTGWRYRAPRAQRTSIGFVFQQPRTAADPRLTLADLIAEPLRATRAVPRRDRAAADEHVRPLAASVGLTGDLLTRRPHEVSDGQLQRACLARALVLRPSLLICDEMTAMLDASTTATLVNAVESYRAETGAALLAIGHDRPLLTRWCARLVDYPALPVPASAGPRPPSLRETAHHH
ncbi:ABC transporter ATP-binding protein [Actinocorallia populi]|uniref:ABC transporter ATP-binding protein n=1 Tax=Actinocorallia populi TaxID=2079200 RepID=UPI000D08A6A4|nr:ATP-binding cassette domain-containing protein [Actinocorallia populi]